MFGWEGLIYVYSVIQFHLSLRLLKYAFHFGFIFSFITYIVFIRYPEKEYCSRMFDIYTLLCESCI
jgi:hypothetical protein